MMRLVAGAAVLLALACATPPAWEQPPPAPLEGPVVPADRLHRTTLENGLKLIVLEDTSVPRVVFGVSVRRGAGSLPVGDAGLASWTAELMKRGAGDRGAVELALAVESLGASLSTSAGWDSSTAAVSGLRQDEDVLLAILADVVLRPRFDPEEAERLRSQRLSSLEKDKDSPDTLARWALYRTLYEGHAYGLPLRGTPETVKAFDAQRARAVYERLWVPSNAIFYATGDVDAKDMERRVREAFGSWQGGAPPEVGPLAPVPTPQARRVVIVNRPDQGQAQILVAHEGLTRSDDRRIGARLMNTVIGGGGFSSRIMGAVREDAGLAYYAYSYFSGRRLGGFFVATTATRVPEADRSIDLILDELEKARSTDPPTAEEVAHAKTSVTGRFALGLETSDAIVGSLVDLDVEGLPEDSLDTYRSRVAALTPADTARLARELLHPDRAAIVVVGPAEALKPMLERFGPVEVVEP